MAELQSGNNNEVGEYWHLYGYVSVQSGWPHCLPSFRQALAWLRLPQMQIVIVCFWSIILNQQENTCGLMLLKEDGMLNVSIWERGLRWLAACAAQGLLSLSSVCLPSAHLRDIRHFTNIPLHKCQLQHPQRYKQGDLNKCHLLCLRLFEQWFDKYCCYVLGKKNKEKKFFFFSVVKLLFFPTFLCAPFYFLDMYFSKKKKKGCVRGAKRLKMFHLWQVGLWIMQHISSERMESCIYRSNSQHLPSHGGSYLQFSIGLTFVFGLPR